MRVGFQSETWLSRKQKVICEVIIPLRQPRLYSQEAIEEQKGVRGYHTLHGALETVSTEKANLDDQKKATLEDMATMVTSLNARILEKKGRLAPVIKDLRPLRKTCQVPTQVQPNILKN